MTGTTTAIHVENLERVYRSVRRPVYALRGINLHVDAGHFVVLRGRSGSGKTTLLNCIGGLDRPTAGTITVYGRSLSDMDDQALTQWRQQEVGFIFQSFGLLPTLSAYENVELMLRIARVPGRQRRQRAKIIAALAAINADIFGLIEMENTTGVEPLQDIVDGLNAELGAGTYAYIDTGTIGSDVIKVGLIYNPGTVTPVGDYAILDSNVDSRFDDDKNRPVLAQTFMENASGSVLTVAVNHLKSKGSPCGPGDDDPQQGNCNLTRTLAAEALVDWLASDPTGSGDSDFLITGDLNAYDLEDPIDAVRAGADDTLGTDDDYIDLIFEYDDELAYSFVFDGQFGYLDYALAVKSLASQVAGTTVWHINADEPDILDYDTSFKRPAQEALYEPNPYRSSDHDPVIVGLDPDG